MGIGPFIVARLTADATISAIVGQNVFDAAGPQGVQPPFIVFEEFDGTRYSQMGVDSDICDCRLRLHLWHNTVPERDALSTAVRKSLQRYTGSLAGTTVDDVYIVPGGPNLFDQAIRAWHAVRDFRIVYRET